MAHRIVITLDEERLNEPYIVEDWGREEYKEFCTYLNKKFGKRVLVSNFDLESIMHYK